ncbi:aluminum-activated malate transporter 2-like [Henckelia pumila]|uniref:aluminum-activated malate transporter 2-like n=1 Tax=Henckelia pumila TaxID=405737 RepID=UPI003C6E9A9C
MKMVTENQEIGGVTKNARNWVNSLINKLVNVVINAVKEAKKLAEDDPRRVVHSFKVGLAIILVSLFYYFDDPIYDGFGVSAMWAIITVVVVFEFSVGATLGKGVNRGIATLLGGAFGVGAHRLAEFSGDKVEPIFLGLSVFLIAALVTFMRFHPKLKAKYDYGLVIIILTVSLTCVSGYRDDGVLDIAYIRLSTVLIGGAVSVFICAFIRPIWAGEDLHNLTAANIEKLGIFLEGFADEYFKSLDRKNQETKKTSLAEYKSVLNSKGTEESLVNFAKWEPRHGKFRYRQPWDQYLKIVAVTRECAYRIEALSGYLNSEMQTPMEIRAKIQELCTKMSTECSCALTELSAAIKKMTRAAPADVHILNAKNECKNLRSLFSKLWPDADLVDIIPAATVASLLIEIVSCTARIADSVHELASLSKYKGSNDAMRQSQTGKEKILPMTSGVEGSHNVSIMVE